MRLLLLGLALCAIHGRAQDVGSAFEAAAFFKPTLSGGGGGSPTYYYSAPGTTPPDLIAYFWTGFLLGDVVTVGASGTLTKIGVYVDNIDTAAHDVKISVWYDSGGGTYALHECGTITVPQETAVGWQDFTLVTPKAVTASQTLRIMAMPDADVSVGIYGADVAGGYKSAPTLYANACQTTPPSWSAESQIGVRTLIVP